MQKQEILKRLVKEDKSGLAYCMNQMKGYETLGYHIYITMTKRELIEKTKNLTDTELMRLKSFQTYKDLFI